MTPASDRLGPVAGAALHGRIVVVDDHSDVRTLLSEVLRAHGFSTVDASTGSQAIELVGEHVDAVLLDVDLPDLSGLDVLDAVRSRELAPPVIMLTGSIDRDAAHYLGRGAHDFMLKPPRVEELVARVGAAVRVKRLQDELRITNRLLTHQAMTDPLTALANRRHGHNELDRLVASAQRHRRSLGVLMCDLDHFKALNDTYGHQAGDTCLREAARRMQRAVRRDDLAVRWGGEEFAVLMPDASTDHAAEVAERIRSDVADPPFPTAVEPVRLTMSVGWAMYRVGESGADLLARADRALYDAKRRGRNAVVGVA